MLGGQRGGKGKVNVDKMKKQRFFRPARHTSCEKTKMKFKKQWKQAHKKIK